MSKLTPRLSPPARRGGSYGRLHVRLRALLEDALGADLRGQLRARWREAIGLPDEDRAGLLDVAGGG
jgi:hypothetical protein